MTRDQNKIRRARNTERVARVALRRLEVRFAKENPRDTEQSLRLNGSSALRDALAERLSEARSRYNRAMADRIELEKDDAVTGDED